MLLQQIKCVIFIFLVFSALFSEEKIIKKITSDVTEYDRKANVINFLGNVKIEMSNGYILCKKANYKEKEGRITCETDVYFFYYSTFNNTFNIEVKSEFLDYDGKNQCAEFKNKVSVLYISTQQYINNIPEFSKIDIKCNYVYLDKRSSDILIKDSVEIYTQDANIQCNVAQYNYKEEFLVLNSQEVLDKVENNIKIVPLTEKWNMKLCKAKSAKVDIQKDKVYLIGDVEITF